MVSDYIKTCKEVILRPADFFSKMPTTGGYAEPLTFASISQIIHILLFKLVSYGMFTLGIRSSILTLGMQSSSFNFSIFSNFIELFLIGIVFIFISALIYNYFYAVHGGTGNYEGTVRFICYSNAIAVLTWIPVIGMFFGLYGVYIQIVGGSFVHNVSMRKSTKIVFLPFILIFTLAFVMLFICICSSIILNFYFCE